MKKLFIDFKTWILISVFIFAGNLNLLSQEDIIYIPTVVHVIYTDSSYTNISDAQIYSAIDALNDDFRRRVGTQGYGNGADTEIEFCLAHFDPDGYPTSGIDRIYCTGNCALGYDMIGIVPNTNEIKVKDLSRWPVEHYYNIWVVHKIGVSAPEPNGFSYMPGANPDLEGAVVLYSAFGIGHEFDGILDPTTNLNRTITHITGHYLDLFHTFEGDNNGTECPSNNDCIHQGDWCCDTPPHIRSNNDCKDDETNECDNFNSNKYFVHNYMDYSSESCKNEFTGDQTNRMRALFLQNGFRKEMLNSQGCYILPIGTDCIDQNIDFEGFNATPYPPNDWHSESLSIMDGWEDGGYTTPWYCNTPENTYIGISSYSSIINSIFGNE